MIALDVAVGALGAPYLLLPAVWLADRRHGRLVAQRSAQVPPAYVPPPPGYMPPLPADPEPARHQGQRLADGVHDPARVFDPDARPPLRDQHGHFASKAKAGNGSQAGGA